MIQRETCCVAVPDDIVLVFELDAETSAVYSYPAAWSAL